MTVVPSQQVSHLLRRLNETVSQRHRPLTDPRMLRHACGCDTRPCPRFGTSEVAEKVTRNANMPGCPVSAGER
jgi:hydrogenase maturation factor